MGTHFAFSIQQQLSHGLATTERVRRYYHDLCKGTCDNNLPLGERFRCQASAHVVVVVKATLEVED